jgi:L-aspartate semialdehyde sulfurtransferase ferredoxin
LAAPLRPAWESILNADKRPGRGAKQRPGVMPAAVLSPGCWISTLQFLGSIMSETKEIIYLSFPPDVSNQPVVCNLARFYDLTFNILRARISPKQEGHMTIEIAGDREKCQQGMRYLRDQGVQITPVAQKIRREEDSCVHCGLCTALCPTKALRMDVDKREVLFIGEKCSACGLCTSLCPVKAMVLETENGIWETITEEG